MREEKEEKENKIRKKRREKRHEVIVFPIFFLLQQRLENWSSFLYLLLTNLAIEGNGYELIEE